MRVRAEAKFESGPVAWLAMAVWLSAGLTAWAQQAPGAQGGALGLRAGEKMAPARIQEIYRKVLADWSAGETERAPDELIELEAAVVQDADAGTRKILLKEEQAGIHPIGAPRPQVLVALALLHHETYPRPFPRGFSSPAAGLVPPPP